MLDPSLHSLLIHQGTMVSILKSPRSWEMWNLEDGLQQDHATKPPSYRDPLVFEKLSCRIPS